MRVSGAMELANKDAAGVAEELEAVDGVLNAHQGQHDKHLCVSVENLDLEDLYALRDNSWTITGVRSRTDSATVFFHKN